MPDSIPQYVRLQQELRERILDRQFKPGSRIPSRNEIMEKFGYARVTVDRAISGLMKEGYLRGERGSGTYVVDVDNHAKTRTTVYVVQHRPAAFTETAIGPMLERITRDFDLPYELEFVAIGDLCRSPDRFVSNARAALFCQLDPRYLDFVEYLKDQHCPVLLINRRDQGYDYVANDVLGGMRLALDNPSIKRVGIIAERPRLQKPYQQEYISCFYQAAAVAGLETRMDWHFEIESSRVVESVDGMLALLRMDDRPDTFYTSAYAIPYLISSICAAGLELGKDIRMFHYDSVPETNNRLGVTSMTQDFERMGVEALNWLRRIDAGESKEPFQVLVPPIIDSDYANQPCA